MFKLSNSPDYMLFLSGDSITTFEANIENPMYVFYLNWVAEGNTAEPADEPAPVVEAVEAVAQPTQAEMQAQIAVLQEQLAAVMSMLNTNSAN